MNYMITYYKTVGSGTTKGLKIERLGDHVLRVWALQTWPFASTKAVHEVITIKEENK